MSSKLRLGIIGCGDIAGFTALLARLNRRIQLTACCDRSTDRGERFSRRHRVPCSYLDYREMLAHESLDAVYLAVPHHLHAEMLQASIESNVHILVEKPITRTLSKAIEIVQLAQEKGIKLGVNYQYRYDSGCYALARAVQEGVLGQVNYARCNVPWRREPSYFEDSPWHARLDQAGGGTLITQASHMIDILLWAIEKQANRAMGFASQLRFVDVEVEDLAQATVELEGGILVQICSSMIAQPESALSIEVYGERGTAIYRDRPLPHLRFHGVRGRKKRPPVWGIHALQRSLEGFRAWVQDEKHYLIPGAAALPALAVVEAIYRSAKSGQREDVTPLPPQ